MLRAHVPDAELAILKILWARESATVREIAESLYDAAGASEQATVQKLLERLESRSCVERRRDGRVNVWSARVRREELVSDRLRDAADKLCEGSLSPLLTQLVRGSRLSPGEVEELRRLIDQVHPGDTRPETEA